MTQDLTYSIIPTPVLTAQNLNEGAKCLYALINSRARKYGYCVALDDHLADTLNKSVRTIQYRLKVLLKAKLIHVKHKQSFRRKIYMGPAPVEIMGPPKPEHLEAAGTGSQQEKNLHKVQNIAEHSATSGRHNKGFNTNQLNNINIQGLGRVPVKEFWHANRPQLLEYVRAQGYKDPGEVVDLWYITNHQQGWENQTAVGWMQRLDGYLANRNNFFCGTPVLHAGLNKKMCA